MTRVANDLCSAERIVLRASKRKKIEKEKEKKKGVEAYKGRNRESLQNYNIGRYDETSEMRIDSKGGNTIPTGFFLPAGGPKIPGMRKQKRKKRTFVKITCDDDVRAGERGYWHYSWRQTLDDLDEPVVRCLRMLEPETIMIYDKIICYMQQVNLSDLGDKNEISLKVRVVR